MLPKKGDKIKIRDNREALYTMSKNIEYTVTKYNCKSNYFYFINDGDCEDCYIFEPTYFEIVNKKNYKFKVGDKVKRVSIGFPTEGIKVGDIMTINSIRGSWIYVEELKLVQHSDFLELVDEPNKRKFRLNDLVKLDGKYDCRVCGLYPNDSYMLEFITTGNKTTRPIRLSENRMKFIGMCSENSSLIFKNRQEETKMEFEKPKTQLEKTACKEAVSEAVKVAIANKKVVFQQGMDELIQTNDSINKRKEELVILEKNYKELATKLGIGKEEEKQLF